MDASLSRRQLVEQVRDRILACLAQDRAGFLDLMDEQSVVILAGSRVYRGRSSVERYPPSLKGVRVSDATFRTLDIDKRDEAVILGTYLLSGPCADGTVRQRVTAGLRLVDGSWKIDLAHFSNEWSMSEAAGEKAPEGTRRLQLRSEDGLVFVDPDDLIYAESAGKRCVLHLTDRTVTVSALLGELCDLLPGQFVRAGRFYTVNVGYVQSVGREGIAFTTGETIPVPARRAREIQAEISAAITRHFG